MKNTTTLLVLFAGAMLASAETPANPSAAREALKDGIAEKSAQPAKPAKPEPTLKVGSEVTVDAIGKCEWIQGEGPKAWEPGKVYIFECWATWCGPCIAAIPHVNELHKKYADKGLRVVGMNVWERKDKQAVADFVKGKGEGMSYPVAFAPKGGVFETEWLNAGGVRGIPHAFVVKDGKIVMMSHPMRLTNEVIEKLLGIAPAAPETKL